MKFEPHVTREDSPWGPSRHRAEVEYRLNEKLKQAKAGKSDQSAYACVVGFRVKRVALGKLKEETDSE